MTRPTTFLLRLFVPLMAAWAISAAPSLAKVPAVSKVRVGFFESEGMYNGAGEGERKSGYCYDYLMHISSYTGWKYEFCYGTFSELYEKLKNGEIDILPYTNKNATREREVLYSDSMMAEEEYYLVGGSNEFDTIRELNKAVVSTVAGYDSNSLLTDFISKNCPGARVTYYPSINDAWDALRNGKVDATVWTSNSFSHDDWKSICSFGKKPTYICVAKDRPDILERLNEATGLINQENPSFFAHLYEKYFSDNPVRSILTDEETEWVREHRVLRVGGFPNDAPYIYSYDDKTKTATGLTVDLINGIIDRLGIDMKAEFRCYASLAEMEAALTSGKLDLIIPFYPDYGLAQEHNLIISNVVRVSNMEIVYRAGSTFPEVLDKVATPVTKLGVYYVRDNFPFSEIVGAVSIQDAVDKVLSGEAESAIAQNVVLHNIVGKYDNLNSMVLSTGCGTCFAARPENYALVRILNRGLMFFSSAEISAISARYLLDPNVTVRAFLASHKDLTLFVVIIVFGILLFLLLMMAKLKSKADEANKSKTSFLFNMSHDIRTPMNAIMGFTDMALRHSEDQDTTRDCLRKIKASSGHLLDLINDILEMSRIEAGKLELTQEPIDIREVVTNTTYMAKALAAPKSIDFQTVVGEMENPYVYADELHLNEVFINIISNAIKYSNEDSTVRFEVCQIGEASMGMARYRVEIADHGIGMSEDFQKHIFERFSREKSATVSKQEGAGLGLSIVKRIIDLAGGTIDIRSQLGEGTTVTVELPLQIMDDKAMEAFKSSHDEVAKPRYDSDALKGKRALLVEDNKLNREIAEEILKELGMMVVTAEDGSVAVRIVTEKGVSHFDVILMDIQMPVMNGYEATRAIRNLPHGDEIPIVAVSANAFQEDRKKSHDAGMNEHIAKPIEVDALKETLANLVS